MSNQAPHGKGYPVLGRLLPPVDRGGALFDDQLQEFLLNTKCEGLGTLTISKLHRMLMEYVHWLSRRHQRRWCHVQRDDLQEYLALFVEASDSTAASRRWMLQRLYRWAQREKLRADDPTSHFELARAAPRVPPYVPTVRQVERLLATPDAHTAIGLRDRAVIEVLYATGMRAAELVGLRMHQVDRKDRVIRVMGKGSRERLVIYGMQASDWLERYLAASRSVLIHQGFGYARPTDAVFVHPSPMLAMQYFHLRGLVRKHAQQANLPLVTPHVLRHAYATHLYARGMDLRSLQTLLGHANLSTTTIYIQSGHEALQALLEKHHPRGVHFASEALAMTGMDRRRRRRDTAEPAAG